MGKRNLWRGKCQFVQSPTPNVLFSYFGYYLFLGDISMYYDSSFLYNLIYYISLNMM